MRKCVEGTLKITVASKHLYESLVPYTQSQHSLYFSQSSSIELDGD